MCLVAEGFDLLRVISSKEWLLGGVDDGGETPNLTSSVQMIKASNGFIHRD